MTVELDQAKKALRADMLARRSRMTAQEVRAAGASIAALVLASPNYAAAQTICSYLAIGNEAPTLPILHAALAGGKRVALPRTLLPDRRLLLHQVDTLSGLVPGRYGIPEPAAEAPIIPAAEVELFLVPGSVFDAEGNRLGYGAGLYDSVLAASAGCRMALAFAWQVAPHVPTGAHDMPMDLLVTELAVLDCRQRRALRIGGGVAAR